jgi:hypothetical protein
MGTAKDLFAGMDEKERALKMKEIEWNEKAQGANYTVLFSHFN